MGRRAAGHRKALKQRRRRPVAALASARDLALRERLEDKLDIEEADRAQAEDDRSGKPNLSWDTLKKCLGP
jgi:hypothetical protein